MNIVLFTQEESKNPIPPKDERAKHLLNILHKKAGDTFEAGIIGKEAGRATITKIDDSGIFFDFEPLTDGKKLFPICLIVGFPRPIQLKRLFRDVAGLGVEKLYLCGTELGEKSYLDSNIVANGAAEQALKDGTIQAHSTHIPELRQFSSVKECLEFVNAEQVKNRSSNQVIKTMLDNVKPTAKLSSFLCEQLNQQKQLDVQNIKPYIYASIGSERGWTDFERSLFEKNGFVSCSMGERVLRTETATTVATTLILQSLEIL